MAMLDSKNAEVSSYPSHHILYVVHSYAETELSPLQGALVNSCYCFHGIPYAVKPPKLSFTCAAHCLIIIVCF